MQKAEPEVEDLSDDKLESWKEIASYVDRTVSTVKRWERSEGLPVHRHVHNTQGSVYASKAEIDDWRKKRSESPGLEPASRASAWKARALVFAALLGAALLTWLAVPLGQRAGSPDGANPRIWVLVTDFENNTAESLFDGTVSDAMKRSLSLSPRLAVVPQERIDDVLRLMKKPLDTTIDPVLAREICQRDAQIDVIVGGRVETAPEGFRLTTRILDPATGATTAARSLPVPDSGAILRVVDGLGEWAKGSLGEEISPGAPGRRQLEKATTPSLKALQLYSRGMQMGYRKELANAKPFFEFAIEEDPDFASAQVMLAWAIFNQIPVPERVARKVEYIGPAERALELSARLPDRERLWIEGSYFFLNRQYPEAAARYESLLSLQPDHFWATSNLVHYYSKRVRHHDNPEAIVRAIRYEKARADLRPNDFRTNASAAYSLAYSYSDFDGADTYARRAQALLPLPSNANPIDVDLSVTVRVLPAVELFLDGHPEALLSALQRMESDSASSLKPALSWYYLMLGQLGKARSLIRSERDAGVRHNLAADLAYSLDDKKALKEELKLYWERHLQLSAFKAALLIRAGLLAEGEAACKTMDDLPFFDLDMKDAVRALLALSRGNVEDSDSLMEAAMSCPLSCGEFLVAAEAQAESLQERDRPVDAVGVLERALTRRGSMAEYYHYAWRLEVRLSRLYRSLGRVEEAQAVEDRLLKRLSLADPDHPAVLAVRDGTPWLEP